MHFLSQHPQIGKKWIQSLKNWIFSIFSIFTIGDLSKTQWFRKWKWHSKWFWKPIPILHYNFCIVHCMNPAQHTQELVRTKTAETGNWTQMTNTLPPHFQSMRFKAKKRWIWNLIPLLLYTNFWAPTKYAFCIAYRQFYFSII